MYVSPTKNGKVHDFTQAKKELLFDNVPDKVCLWVDKGFQGIKNIVPPEQVEIPHKNLRENLYPLSKSKKTRLYLALESLLSMQLVV